MTTGEDVRELPIEVGDLTFTLYVFPVPSGLRGEVFHGDEKIAGYRIYHSDDAHALRAQVMRDRAFREAVERLSADATASGA